MNTSIVVEENNFFQNNYPNVTIRSNKKINFDVDQEYLSSDLDTPRTSIVKNKENELKQIISNNLYPILNSDVSTLCQIDTINDTKVNIKSNINKDIDDLKNEFNELNLNDVFEEKEIELDPLELKLRKDLSVFNIDILKKKLKENKCSIGPINSHNQRLYVNKLAKLQMGKINGNVSSLFY